MRKLNINIWKFHHQFCFLQQALTVTQIKGVRTLIDENMAKCNEEVGKVEQLRNEKLFEVGNLLHESVPISNDEVCEFNIFNVWTLICFGFLVLSWKPECISENVCQECRHWIVWWLCTEQSWQTFSYQGDYRH